MSGQGVGTVKWYNPEKAYGFITAEDGQDLFVHRNSIAEGRSWLVDGQGVEFTVREGRKGPEAADVRVVRDVEEIPPARQRSYESIGAGGYGSYGNANGAYRTGAPRRPRESYTGSVPSGPVPATVMRIDLSGRFLFVRAESVGDDVYVHGSLFANLGLREGDTVSVVVERGERGLRARSLGLA